MNGKFDLYPFKIGEILTLRKTHPCGSNIWIVERTGQEITMRCKKCNHLITIARKNLEKAVKKIESIDG